MAIEYKEVEGRYIDSVLLMQITRELEQKKSVEKAAIMAATEENLKIFRDIGFEPPSDIKSTSILIAVETKDEDSAENAIEQALNMMDTRVETETEETFTLDQVSNLIDIGDDFPLLFISTPGKYVEDIAIDALSQGSNLHVFSSNVPLETEVKLKKMAHEKGLFVLGPDAGTTIIEGAGIGFANVIRRGDITIIGSSGTGIQELTILLDKGGLGINAALGVGTNDFTEDVDAIMTKQAIEMMNDSKMFILVAKKPSTKVRDEVIEMICDKPSVFVSLGDNESSMSGETFLTGYVDEAVNFALKQFDKEPLSAPEVKEHPSLEGRKYVRGMFVGGSLCYQAQAILKRSGIEVYSNAPLDKGHLVERDWDGRHACIDTGAEEYVQGKPHPMIDPRGRNEMVVQESKKEDVAVILMDIMLGYGSTMDPLDGLEDVVDGPLLVASIDGTRNDPQDYDAIEKGLKDLGIKVFASAGQAAEYAAKVLEGLK
jgi:FdrA protein